MREKFLETGRLWGVLYPHFEKYHICDHENRQANKLAGFFYQKIHFKEELKKYETAFKED